MEMEMTRTVRW